MSNWQLLNNEITKTFLFPDFTKALQFVNEVGKLAERANHHPDIELSYGKVTIRLSTHSEERVTKKDRDLATSIDELLLVP